MKLGLAFVVNLAIDPGTMSAETLQRLSHLDDHFASRPDHYHVVDDSHLADALNLIEEFLQLARRMDACHPPQPIEDRES